MSIHKCSFHTFYLHILHTLHISFEAYAIYVTVLDLDINTFSVIPHLSVHISVLAVFTPHVHLCSIYHSIASVSEL